MVGKVVGIDPGVTGAIGLLFQGRYIDVEDMPTMAKGAKGKKQQVNAAALADLLGAVRPDLVVVEQVAAMPGQGVSSTFNFGEGFGVIRGVCAALGLPVVFVTPSKWKKRFGLLASEKDLARTKAIELFPKAPLARKKDIGRADALLIARYGWEEAELQEGRVA